MSASCCPQPRRPGPGGRIDVLTVTVHPLGPCRAEEELADRLDAEQRAHAVTREALASAQAELEQLRPVLDAAQAVRAVLNMPTTPEQQDAHLGRLAGPLLQLELALMLSSLSTFSEASASASAPQSTEVSHG